MDPLFPDVISLSEFFDRFHFGEPIEESYPPAFVDYANFFVYVRLRLFHPFPGANTDSQQLNDLKNATIKEFKAYWARTRDEAFFRAIKEHIYYKFGLLMGIHYIREPSDEAEFKPKINIFIPNKSLCYQQLRNAIDKDDAKTYTAEEINALTTSDFHALLQLHFENISAAECTVISYEITRWRHDKWIRMATRYEVNLINEFEYKEKKTKCPSTT